MTHRFFQTIAGADDTSACDATELKWEFDEDLGRYYVLFPDDQWWSSVGTIGELAFGVVFFSFGSVVGPMYVFWMMYEFIYVLCEVAIVSQSLSHSCSLHGIV